MFKNSDIFLFWNSLGIHAFHNQQWKYIVVHSLESLKYSTALILVDVEKLIRKMNFHWKKKNVLLELQRRETAMQRLVCQSRAPSCGKMGQGGMRQKTNWKTCEESVRNEWMRHKRDTVEERDMVLFQGEMYCRNLKRQVGNIYMKTVLGCMNLGVINI